MFDFSLISKLLINHLTIELKVSAASFSKQHHFNRETFDRVLRNKPEAKNIKVETLCKILHAANINLVQVLDISILDNSPQMAGIPLALKHFLSDFIRVIPEYYKDKNRYQILSYSDKRLGLTLTPYPDVQSNNKDDTQDNNPV